MVAAGPRFLKCYDVRFAVNGAVVVAAGPRFLKCYDVGSGGEVDAHRCSWTAISEML